MEGGNWGEKKRKRKKKGLLLFEEDFEGLKFGHSDMLQTSFQTWLRCLHSSSPFNLLSAVYWSRSCYTASHVLPIFVWGNDQNHEACKMAWKFLYNMVLTQRITAMGIFKPPCVVLMFRNIYWMCCKCSHLHYIEIYFLHEIRHLIIHTTLSICSFGNNKPATENCIQLKNLEVSSKFILQDGALRCRRWGQV